MANTGPRIKGDGATTRRAGYRYIHTAIGDRSRIAYSEIHDDEQGKTAAGFLTRAAVFFAAMASTRLSGS